MNGEKRELRDKEYMPDVMHQHLIDFITKHRAEPFYVYYSMSHVHAEILPTPDSAPGSKDLYADNISYMDKLVGKLTAELDRLGLREKTLIVFFGDNGTGSRYAAHATISGRRLSGEKGSMREGGALVPMIVNWPGTTPAGKVFQDLVDSTDFFPTFAELACAKLPDKTVLDGRSLAVRFCGGAEPPRDWAFIQLAKMWYVRESGWKLNQAGELFDMSHAPFEEKLVSTITAGPEAIAARKRLQTTLNRLNPEGGVLDDGDGTGRHAKNKGKKD